MQNNPYSTHLFLFPFIWEVKKGINQANHTIEVPNITDFLKKLPQQWKYVKASLNTEQDYNESIYFYPWAHNVIYSVQPMEKQDLFLKQAVFNFEYELGTSKKENARYIITIGNDHERMYELSVDAIKLKIYDTGVGIVSLHTTNRNYNQLQDILNINEFGRRIYSPFIPLDQAKGVVIANQLSLTLSDGTNIVEDFSHDPFTEPNKISNIIQSLLGDQFTSNRKKNTIHILPIMDDRMFVMSWYGNNSFVDELKGWNKDSDSYGYKDNSNWYQFIFVDNNGPTCVSRKMFPALTMKHTYTRWIDYGTLFGLTHYSFMILTDENPWAMKNISTHLGTIYYQMVCLLLAQKACIMRISNVLIPSYLRNMEALTQNENEDCMKKIYQQYGKYITEFSFDEITAQDQGKELYDRLIKMFRIPKQLEDLKTKIAIMRNLMNK